jgi:hypothetical protein
VDLYGMTFDEAKGLCPGGATVDAAKCAQANVAAGCQHVEGATCTTHWYYSPTTADIVKAGCHAPDVYRTP